MHGEKRDGRSNAEAVVQERRAGSGWYSLADATALSRKVDVEVERDIARAMLAVARFSSTPAVGLPPGSRARQC